MELIEYSTLLVSLMNKGCSLLKFDQVKID